MLGIRSAQLGIFEADHLCLRSTAMRGTRLPASKVKPMSTGTTNVRAEVKGAARAACYAPSREVADMAAADVLETHQIDYPSALRAFQDDWEASVAYLCCPAIHHPC